MCRSRKLGGLGIADLKSLGIALKARWPLLKRSAPNKPWANLPIQVSKEAAGLISVAVITEVGNGSNTLFWKDKWLDGKGIQDIAPLIFALIPKQRWGNSLCVIKKDRNALYVPGKVQRSSALLLQLFCALHATVVSLGSNAVKL